MSKVLPKVIPACALVQLLSGCDAPIYDPHIDMKPLRPCIGDTVTVHARNLGFRGDKVYIYITGSDKNVILAEGHTSWFSDIVSTQFVLASTVVSVDGKTSMEIRAGDTYWMNGLATDGKYNTPMMWSFIPCPEQLDSEAQEGALATPGD